MIRRHRDSRRSSRDFLLLIGVAILIAIPIAHFGMQNWIRQFAFQAGVSVVMYVLIATIAVAIALVTIGTQALNGATKNPVEALRNE